LDVLPISVTLAVLPARYQSYGWPAIAQLPHQVFPRALGCAGMATDNIRSSTGAGTASHQCAKPTRGYRISL
jgi:hypothetical protein